MGAKAKYLIIDIVGHFAEERIMARSLKVLLIYGVLDRKISINGESYCKFSANLPSNRTSLVCPGKVSMKSSEKTDTLEIKALTFDVFGTVVDWRGSIIREGEAFGVARGLDVDWAQFADKWRAGYGPSMNRVRKGELPWLNIDALHRMILDGLLDEFEITGLSEAEKDHLNRVWHRLTPWPDAISGLQRLRERFIVAPLSNGKHRLAHQYGETRRATMGLHSVLRVGEALQTGSGGLPNRRRLARSSAEPSDDGRRSSR